MQNYTLNGETYLSERVDGQLKYYEGAAKALALLTGVANFRKFGDLWLTYRMTEELLKTEKFLFLTGSGKYHSASSPFAQFVPSIEEIVSSEHIKFRSIIEETAKPSEEGANTGEE